MKAVITRVEPRKSQRTSGHVYFVCFKCEDGKSRSSWIDSGFGNYSHWNGLLKVGNSLDGLTLNTRGNIDADSYPRIIRPAVGTPVKAEAMTHEEVEKVVTQDKLFDIKPEYRHDY
jgi:hypothetical protein